MIEYVVEIEGMACSMCEAHINDAVRKEFPVKKVSSSHTKGETVIISETELDGDAIRRAISATGYNVNKITSRPYEKKRLFSFGK